MNASRPPLLALDRVLCAKCGEDYRAGHFCNTHSLGYIARSIHDTCDALSEDCVPLDLIAPIRAYADSLMGPR